MCGMSLSSPQAPAHPAASAAGRRPRSCGPRWRLAAAHPATDRAPSARTFDGSRASTLPLLPAARTPQARKAASLCDSKFLVKGGVERAGADQRPQRMHACLARALGIENQFLQLAPRLPRGFARTAAAAPGRGRRYSGCANARSVVHRVSFARSNFGARRVLVANAVEPAAQAVDAVGIAVGVLVAVIAVVPVEDVQAAVRPRLLRHRHEPGVVGGQEIRPRLGEVGRAVARQSSQLMQLPWMLPMYSLSRYSGG